MRYFRHLKPPVTVMLNQFFCTIHLKQRLTPSQEAKAFHEKQRSLHHPLQSPDYTVREWQDGRDCSTKLTFITVFNDLESCLAVFRPLCCFSFLHKCFVFLHTNSLLRPFHSWRHMVSQQAPVQACSKLYLLCSIFFFLLLLLLKLSIFTTVDAPM